MTVTYFIAFTPDAELGQLIRSYKNQVYQLVGDQLYLSDPPHLTVFLASFPQSIEPGAILQQFSEYPSPRIRLTGWHSWMNDPLTSLNTLVCNIDERDIEILRTLQQAIVQTLSSLRDPDASTARYQSRWHTLIQEQRDNVSQFGFPFLQSGWHPHVTIASIRPDSWDRVYDDLISKPPYGDYTMSSLDVYELQGALPVHRYRINLIPRCKSQADFN